MYVRRFSTWRRLTSSSLLYVLSSTWKGDDVDGTSMSLYVRVRTFTHFHIHSDSPRTEDSQYRECGAGRSFCTYWTDNLLDLSGWLPGYSGENGAILDDGGRYMWEVVAKVNEESDILTPIPAWKACVGKVSSKQSTTWLNQTNNDVWVSNTKMIST